MNEIRIKTESNFQQHWDQIEPIVTSDPHDALPYLIAHALSECDNVYEIRVGKLKHSGKYYQGPAWYK